MGWEVQAWGETVQQVWLTAWEEHGVCSARVWRRELGAAAQQLGCLGEVVVELTWGPLGLVMVALVCRYWAAGC